MVIEYLVSFQLYYMHLFPVYHVRFNLTLCFCERFHLPHNIRWSSGLQHPPHRHYWLQTQRRHTQTPTKDQRISRRHTQTPTKDQKISRRHTQTPTKDQKISRGTHWLLQKIKRYQEGTHWLLQRIKRYKDGYHWHLLCQEAHIDSYKGSKDIKRHTLTPTKDQKISRRLPLTPIISIGTHWLLQKHRYQRDTHQLQSIEISKAHTDPNSLKLISRWYTPCSFTTKTEISERLEGKTEISRRNTPDPTETQRYQGGTGTHLLLERNTNWDIKEIQHQLL